MEPAGHSRVDDMSLENYWNYVSKPANTVKWKSECPWSHEMCGVSWLRCYAGSLATPSALAWAPLGLHKLEVEQVATPASPGASLDTKAQCLANHFASRYETQQMLPMFTA